MKGIVFVGDNQYHVGSHFMQGIQQDLMHLSITTDTVDFSDPQQSKRLVTCEHSLSQYDFILSYNGVGVALRTMNDELAKQIDNMALYVLCVDHPIYQLERISQSNAIMLCVDQEHVEFCRLLGFTAHYFPHAVSADALMPEQFMPVSAKTDEILFPATYFDKQTCQQHLAPVWDQISNFIDQVTNVTHFMQCLGALPLPGETQKVILSPQSLSICLWVDQYLRARDRERVLLTCAHQNIKLTVIGKGSEQYQSVCDFHTYESELDVNDLHSRIRKAKSVLHQSPDFVAGLHERVVMSLALGTLVLTDESFVKSTLPNVVTLNELTTIDNEMYDYKVDACAAQIMNDHTWLHQLIPIMQQLRQKLAKPMTQAITQPLTQLRTPSRARTSAVALNS
jgi:hypothetical protein